MKQFKHILLLLHGTTCHKKELEFIEKLVQQNKAKLVVAHLLKDLPQDLHTLDQEIGDIDIEQLIREQRQTQFDQDVAKLLLNIQYETKLLVGKAHIAIAEELEKQRYDMIVSTTEDEEHINQSFLSSTNMFLMRKCQQPVFLIHPKRPHKLKKIMATVDLSAEEPAKIELNHKILKTAAELANVRGGELHVLDIWRYYGESALRDGFVRKPEEEIQKLISQYHEKKESELNELVQKNIPKDIHTKVHLIKGEAGEMIPQEAHRKRIETLIMGSVCRSGIEAFMIGNTVEKVLRDINCSVLIIKPDTL